MRVVCHLGPAPVAPKLYGLVVWLDAVGAFTGKSLPPCYSRKQDWPIGEGQAESRVPRLDAGARLGGGRRLPAMLRKGPVPSRRASRNPGPMYEQFSPFFSRN
jgi:hypothetical protein